MLIKRHVAVYILYVYIIIFTSNNTHHPTRSNISTSCRNSSVQLSLVELLVGAELRLVEPSPGLKVKRLVVKNPRHD